MLISQNVKLKQNSTIDWINKINELDEKKE